MQKSQYKVENISHAPPQKAVYNPPKAADQTPFQPPPQENEDFPVKYQQPTQRPTTTTKVKKTSVVQQQPPPSTAASHPTPIEERLNDLNLNDFQKVFICVFFFFFFFFL